MGNKFCSSANTILPMDQINKPVLNSPVGPLPVYRLLKEN